MAKAMTMTLQPLHDRIVVQRIEEGEVRRGGLIIPDSAKEKPLEAVVIAVGSGKLLENGTRPADRGQGGDKILIAKYAGSDVKLVGKDHIIVREDDVLGVLEEGIQ
jgi:Co-chaperonin GroES (HSP10)